MKATKMVMSSYSKSIAPYKSMHRYGRELPLLATQIMPCTICYIVIELRNMCMHDLHIVVVVLVMLSWTITPSLTYALYVRYGMFLVFTTKLFVCLLQHDTLMGFHSFLSTDHAPLTHAHWEEGKCEAWGCSGFFFPPLWKNWGLCSLCFKTTS